MKNWLDDLKQFRYSAALQALIPVHERMGKPSFVNENILFVPFYALKEENFVLASKVFIEYPSFRIVKFEKVDAWKEGIDHDECKDCL